MSTLYQDIKYAIRMMARNPGFTIVVVLILGLGIGATTAVFSVVNGVLLRPLPYKDSDRIAMLFSTHESLERFPSSRLDFTDWKAQGRSFEDMAISRFREATYRHSEGTERIEGMCVSPNLFGLLGLQPLIGRTFSPQEVWPNHHYIILGHEFWKRHFGGDESVLGSAVTLTPGFTASPKDEPYTVVGVMPPGGRFLNTAWSFGDLTEVNAQVDFWIPVNQDFPTSRGVHNWDVVARLKPGVHAKEAQAEMDEIAKRVARQYNDPTRAPKVLVVPLHTHLMGDTRPLVLLGAGGAAFVLLIVCANVTGLLHVRSLARRRETAVRATLGAGRLRLVRQVTTECLLLAALGGVLGLLLASWGIAVFRAIAPHSIPRYEQVTLDSVVIVFVLVVALLTGIAVGLAPALRACKLDLHEALKAGARSTTMGSGQHRLSKILVTTQVALSVTLLIGSGLLINSFSRLLLVDPGYKTRNILTMKIENTRDENCHRILQRAESLPGVRAAALVYGLPLSRDVSSRGTSPPPGHPGDIGRVRVCGRVVTPGYFELMGIPLLAGRDFSEHDNQNSAPVVIINERLARLFWPDDDPIRKEFKYDMTDGMVKVVGIVGNTKSAALDAEAELDDFLPRRQLSGSFLQVMGSHLIAAAGHPKALIQTLRKGIWAIDSHAVITEIRTMKEIVDKTLAVRRFLTVVLSAFSLAALILACFGVYGVMAHSVRQRTHEIGVRMALGARAHDVLKAVVLQGFTLTLIGIALGLAAALALTRTLSSFLYDVSSTDPTTFACVSLLLAAVALLATYIPARRAAKIDPMKALRYE